MASPERENLIGDAKGKGASGSIRHERRLCQEVALHLAYRWFCKLDLDDKVPHHSTFSVNRLGRFRESEILRHIFERVVAQSKAAGLVPHRRTQTALVTHDPNQTSGDRTTRPVKAH